MLYQVSENKTITRYSYPEYKHLHKLTLYFVWKMKVSVLTLRIKILTHHRLLVHIKKPQGVRVHDGPGFESQNIKYQGVKNFTLVARMQKIVALS